MKLKSTTTATLLPALLTVLGCQQPPAAPAQDEPIDQAAYESPGKPNVTGIEVQYQLTDTPTVGTPLSLDLTVSATGPASNVGYSLDADDGLTFAAAQSARMLASETVLEPVSSTLTVTPTREGRFHLRVTANAMIAGEMRSRTITIPIQVGAGERELEPHGEVKTDEDGDPVVSLPATQPQR